MIVSPSPSRSLWCYEIWIWLEEHNDLGARPLDDNEIDRIGVWMY